MLVSCLTPTANRREFWPRCISCFQSQTYPELEWIIVDNGTDPIKDLLPNDPRIKYIRLPGEKLRHGQLMNICMENSTGEVAIVWDDDDFYASNRIAKQVQPLTDPRYDICGTTTLYYYLHGTERGFIYKNLTPQKWLAAPAWRRSIWKKSKFENLTQGADTAFMRKIPMDRWCDLTDLTLLVSTIHKTNAAVKRVPSPSFPSVPWVEVEKVMKENSVKTNNGMVIKLIGGLGNQMFQYAFGLSLSVVKKEEVFFDRSSVDTDSRRCYALGVFGFPIKFSTMGTSVYKEYPYSFNSQVYTTSKNTSFIGYWQTERYFNIPLVKQTFTISGTMSEQSYEVARDIRLYGDQSAFLHVRRTDYLEKDNPEYHTPLGKNYYAAAIAKVREKCENVKFFVFSDDPDWCRTEFPDFQIVDHNKPGGRYFKSNMPGREHEDIWLMSMCRHGIIANSSFSWWGAWLGDEQEDRVVVAPRQWFGPKFASLDTKDIVPERWSKL